MNIADSSKEYVSADLEIPEGFEFEALTVQMAIVAKGTEVVEADWKSAGYDPEVTGRVRLLIGPGSTFGALDVDAYNVWTRIASVIERPVRKAGTLRITATS